MVVGSLIEQHSIQIGFWNQSRNFESPRPVPVPSTRFELSACIIGVPGTDCALLLAQLFVDLFIYIGNGLFRSKHRIKEQTKFQVLNDSSATGPTRSVTFLSGFRSICITSTEFGRLLKTTVAV